MKNNNNNIYNKKYNKNKYIYILIYGILLLINKYIK